MTNEIIDKFFKHNGIEKKVIDVKAIIIGFCSNTSSTNIIIIFHETKCH